jgi:uracil-DNA glycosylase
LFHGFFLLYILLPKALASKGQPFISNKGHAQEFWMFAHELLFQASHILVVCRPHLVPYEVDLTKPKELVDLAQ